MFVLVTALEIVTALTLVHYNGCSTLVAAASQPEHTNGVHIVCTKYTQRCKHFSHHDPELQKFYYGKALKTSIQNGKMPGLRCPTFVWKKGNVKSIRDGKSLQREPICQGGAAFSDKCPP